MKFIFDTGIKYIIDRKCTLHVIYRTHGTHIILIKFLIKKMNTRHNVKLIHMITVMIKTNRA